MEEIGSGSGKTVDRSRSRKVAREIRKVLRRFVGDLIASLVVDVGRVSSLDKDNFRPALAFS